jgi:hypothetical protein
VTAIYLRARETEQYFSRKNPISDWVTFRPCVLDHIYFVKDLLESSLVLIEKRNQLKSALKNREEDTI